MKEDIEINVKDSEDGGIRKELARIRRFLEQRFPFGNDSLVLTIPNQKGDNMGQPQTLTVGLGPVTATAQESKGGVNQPNSGPIAFASDNPAVATIDPASGVINPIAPGTCNISATDNTNIPVLTDSVALTVIAGAPAENDTLVLTVPAQGSGGAVPAAARRK